MQYVIVTAWTVQFLISVYPSYRGKIHFFRSGYICLLGLDMVTYPILKYFYYFQWSFRFLLTLIMVVCYVSIFFVAHQHRSKPGRLAELLSKHKRARPLPGPRPAHRSLVHVLRDHHNDIKVASTISIVILTFTVSWLPAFIAEVAYFPNAGYALVSSYSLTAHLVFWSIYISPALNPVIYAFHNKSIRKLVVRMIRQRHLRNTGSGTYIPPAASNREFVQSTNPVIPFRQRSNSIMSIIGLMNKNRGGRREVVQEENVLVGVSEEDSVLEEEVALIDEEVEIIEEEDEDEDADTDEDEDALIEEEEEEEEVALIEEEDELLEQSATEEDSLDESEQSKQDKVIVGETSL